MANQQFSLQPTKDIPTTYTVFEKDQVLTETQLNAAVTYLDDQERLGRVELVGVGILAGLVPSLSGNTVTVSKGIGVTTDGDLLYLLADTKYTSFKAYGAGAPVYPVLSSAGTAWQLVADGVSDADASQLAQFAAKAGVALDKMTAVLVAETYGKNQDICSGTDCDALGQLAVHDVKLLLVPNDKLTQLKEGFITPDAAAHNLDTVVTARPVVTGVVTVGQLNAAYKSACDTTLNRLKTSLPKLYSACNGILPDLFPTDPANGWINTLQLVVNQLSSSGKGLQYGYDLLKDVVETHNAFREQLFGDTSIACPDPNQFPKHLLLGDLATPTANRTGRYPSPAVAPGRLDHARFLARKLATIINGFTLSSAATSIHVTPTLGEDRSLEERAIPYYYNPKGASPIHESWSHELSQRGMSAFNYSYWSFDPSTYAAKGAAAAPLSAPIGKFPFFRVEGHLGMQVASAMSALQAIVKNSNLPIALHAVLLEQDKTKIIRWFPPIYTDLHRVHRLLRYGLADQLDNVKDYADTLVTQAGIAAVDPKVEPDMKQNAAQVKSQAASGAGKLRQTFQTLDVSWRDDVQVTQRIAGQLKQGLSSVAKTEFTSPIDTVIGSPHLQLLGPLEAILQAMADKSDDKHLFSTLLAEHAGLEHAGGVARGGTFVLAYDTSGVVVGDFMLPYPVEQQATPEPEQPPQKPPPKVWPSWIIDNAVTLGPSVASLIGDKLSAFWAQTQPAIMDQLKSQKDFFQSILLKVTLPSTAGAKVQDPYLNLLLTEMQANVDTVDFLQARLLDPGLTAAQKQETQTQLAAAESALATTASTTTHVVQSSNLDVKPGADGFVAMQAVAGSAQKLTNQAAVKSMRDNLTAVQKSAGTSTALKGMLGTILGVG